jgi:hypothetical protein
MELSYIGTLDDSVYRHPWSGIKTSDFQEILLRQVLTGNPIAINDGYIFQSLWAIDDIKQGDQSLLLQLARLGFLKILCRARNFDEMPERMAGIVGSHTELTERPDYQQIKETASDFGKSIKDCGAYMSWPDVDIGFGFYLLCIAAHRMIREKFGAESLGLSAVSRTMVLSALSEIIRKFHDKPISIRGRLESEVIPKIIDEYRCSEEVAHQFRAALMGLANEFYHVNFSALLSADQDKNSDISTISVETRGSSLFRTLFNDGFISTSIFDDDPQTTFDLDVPVKIATENVDEVLRFITPGTGSFDAKTGFLQHENQIFQGGAIHERADRVKRLNDAIYTTLYGRRDMKRLEPVSRALQLAADNADLVLEGSEKLLSFIGLELYTGQETSQLVEHTLVSLDMKAPTVIRRFGKITSPCPRVVDTASRKCREALLNIGLKSEPCQQYLDLTKKTISEFGSRFPIDNSELAQTT